MKPTPVPRALRRACLLPLLVSATAFAAPFFAQNFDGLEPELIQNSTGSVDVHEGPTLKGVAARGVGAFGYLLGSQQSIAIYELGGGNRVLQLRDNSTPKEPMALTTVHRSFDGKFEMAGDRPILVGSFEFTPLPLADGRRGDLTFAIGQEGATSTDVETTAVQLNISGELVVYCMDGADAIDSKNKLRVGTTYRFDIVADFGGPARDTWHILVTDVSSKTQVLKLTNLKTRASGIVPGHIMFIAANNPGRASSSPHVELDNLTFSFEPVRR